MFKIRIYDKSDHPTEPLFWTLCIISLVLAGIWFLIGIEQSELGNAIFYTAFILMLVTGVIRIVQTVRDYGPFGEVSYLTVTEDSIEFLDKRFKISQVEKIVVRLRDREIKFNRISNNYLEITTRYGEVYKLAILISDTKDEIQVGKMISSLKPKIKKLTYENYL
jgi:hypothetical protein